MITLPFDQATAILSGTLYNTSHASRLFHGVSTDSRTVRRGQLFAALRGSRFDGHDFIDQAISGGAAGLIAERSHPALTAISGNLPVIAVESTATALVQLAAYYRDAVGAKRIAITGSNGKTTTKEVTATILSSVEPHTYRTPGNLNNLIGAPLSIFGMPATTRYAVLEAGISVPGEMARLASLLLPQVVVITNIGLAHIEFLKTREQIAEEKLLLALQSDRPATLIINGDDPILTRAAERLGLTTFRFGLQSSNYLVAEQIEPTPDGGHVATVAGVRFAMNLFGRHQIYNLLAGLSVVQVLGHRISDLDAARLTFTTAPLRGERRTVSGASVIVDCYNANPDSVLSGLESFLEIPAAGRRLAVIGDMLELGEQAIDLHKQIGRLLAKSSINRLLLVGPLSRHAQTAAIEAGRSRDEILHADSVESAAPLFQALLQPGDLVFMKGSRGIGLERLLNHQSTREVVS